MRYNANYGAMRVQASSSSITFEFWSVAGGSPIDTYTIQRGCEPNAADRHGLDLEVSGQRHESGHGMARDSLRRLSVGSGAGRAGLWRHVARPSGGDDRVLRPQRADLHLRQLHYDLLPQGIHRADASIYSGLNLRLLRDDGAVVYLNGTEIWRTNMPAGPVAYDTAASAVIGGTDETTYVSPPATLANTLVDGTNVLAVEIHQSSATSTDISFDLELTGVLAPTGLVCESFNSYTPGSSIGSYTGWYDGGAGPVVTAGNGVASSTGLAADDTIFHWTAHPFNWNAADFQSLSLQMDYRTDADGVFDDDRLAWTIASNSTGSADQFGVQLDTLNDGGIATYWRGDRSDPENTRVQIPIVALPARTANTWYRLRADITKLTATSAKIDVSYVQLDPSGNPTGAVTTGSVPDTSTLGTNAPDTDYFTATSMWPSFKNHNAAAGGAAPADNTCYQVVTDAPAQRALTLNVAPVGGGSVTKFPDKATYNNGESVQLTAVPAAGYAFGSWSGDLMGSANPATLVMDADKTVTANFLSSSSVSFQDGVSGYTGTVDTFIRAGADAGTNYHTSADLQWDDNTADTDEVALIRFTNIFGAAVGQVPAGATILSASLRYRTTDLNSGSTAEGDPANVYESKVDWPEDTVTWNNFGGEAGVQADEYENLVASAPATARSTEYTIDVTASLQRWADNPSANLGWVFLPTADDGVVIYSSDDTTVANHPRLTVIYGFKPKAPVMQTIAVTGSPKTDVTLTWVAVDRGCEQPADGDRQIRGLQQR